MKFIIGRRDMTNVPFNQKTCSMGANVALFISYLLCSFSLVHTIRSQAVSPFHSALHFSQRRRYFARLLYAI